MGLAKRFKKNWLLPTVRRLLHVPGPYQPFGPDFGFAIWPGFTGTTDNRRIRDQVVSTYTNNAHSIAMEDGRLAIPPLYPEAFYALIDRMVDEDLVPAGYLNHQSVNMYQPGMYLKAHVDNLFLYDDLIVTISYGCPQLIKFIHIQNGEQLDAVIPECSVYAISGPARWAYFHMMLPVETQRISIVLRRCMMRLPGTFGVVAPPMDCVLEHRGTKLCEQLMEKEVGFCRVQTDDDWLERENVSAFGEYVKTLQPQRDWTLRSQLEEDRRRVQELLWDKKINMDFSWRFEEIRRQMAVIEEIMTLNKEALKTGGAAAMTSDPLKPDKLQGTSPEQGHDDNRDDN